MDASSEASRLAHAAALAAGYLLVWRVGDFRLREGPDIAALGLGVFVLAVASARQFGRFNGGHAPDQT